MKKKLDFVLSQDEYEQIVFRFYPRRSYVHGFGEKCPQSWDEVYKVYYTWSIIWKADGAIEHVFSSGCDECSVIGDIPEVLKKLKIGEETQIIPCGDGVDWEIKYCPGNEQFNISPYYHFEVWEHYLHRGYRFNLSEQEVADFVRYIEQVSQYMLDHSEPI